MRLLSRIGFLFLLLMISLMNYMEILFFFYIDIKAGYHHIHMRENGIEKTAFRTHLGYHEFKVMSFGLNNARTTFQELMNHIFAHLRKFVCFLW